MTPRRTIVDSLHRCLCPQYFSSLSLIRNGPVAALKHPRPKGFSSTTQRKSESTSEPEPRDPYSKSTAPLIRKLVTESTAPHVRREREQFAGEVPVTFRSPWSEHEGIGKVIDLASREVFPGVFLAAEELVREEGYVPDEKLYAVLIEACAKFPGCLLQGLAFRLVDEMRERRLAVGSAIYHSLLRLLANSPDYIKRSQVLDEMKQRWYSLTDEGWQNVIAGYIVDGHLEMAMEVIEKRRRNGQGLHRNVYKNIIGALCSAGEVDEALRLVRELEAEIIWVTPSSMVYQLLVAATDQLHLEATLYFWRKVIDGNLFSPDDGLCLAALNVAARYGEPTLASDVFRVLGNRGLKFEEQHYAALLEAYAVAGDLLSAFSVLPLIRGAGIVPTNQTAHPVVKKLIESDELTVQETFKTLEAMHRSGKSVDLIALNAMIAVHVARADLEAAFEVYNRFPDFNKRPETSTFNLLFKGAAEQGQKGFALNLVSEMKVLKVPPDANTYESIFLTCLAQPDYEDAFVWLEEMKSQVAPPKLSMYVMLARHCYMEGDSRYRTALAEMGKRGMIANELIGALRIDGKEWVTIRQHMGEWDMEITWIPNAKS